MKRKVNLFGKEISVFVIALFAIVLVSAALVTYLSNAVSTEVTVESPMEQWISTYKGGWGKGPISFNIHGGETLVFYVKTKNNADTAIIGNGKNIVTALEGLTCADFESVSVKTNGVGPWTPNCVVKNSGKVEFEYGPDPITWLAKQVDINEITVTFKTNAVGTYTFTSQVIPETE